MFNNASFRKDSTPLQRGDFGMDSSFERELIDNPSGHDAQVGFVSDCDMSSGNSDHANPFSSFGIAHGRLDRAFFRMMDVFIALVGIILFAPLLAVIAIVMQLTSPGPLLFVQQRVGRKGVMFPCLKIRSMHVNAGEMLARLLEEDPAAREEWAKDFKLRADPRITPTGGILRKTSLDELPQLFNVLVGHMSIVGPRPIVPAEIERYGPHFSDYCSVRPGLTGLWQVSGRNDISYTERVQLDRRYAASKSLPLDVTIILRTVPAMLRARGCY